MERENVINIAWLKQDIWNLNATGYFWQILSDHSFSEQCKGGGGGKQNNI